jgi:protein involved in polysaccharide export with SLBB domain
MSHSSAFRGELNLTGNQHPRVGTRRVRVLRSFLLITTVVLMFVCVTATNAKSQASPSGTQSTGQSLDQQGGDSATDQQGGGSATSASDNSQDDSTTLNGPGSVTPPASLSADQITNILQQNPDLVEELKSQAADRMQEQGMQVDAADISDEEFYGQIASNATLRANITTFLRARGYVSEGDLNSVGASAAQGSTANAAPSRQADLLPSANPGGAGSSAATGTDTTRTSPDQNSFPMTPAFPMGSVSNRSSSGERQRRYEQGNASTDIPKVIAQPAPYSLPSMRDLYTQIPNPVARLRRFGSEIFVNRNIPGTASEMSGRNIPLDVPLGPDYIVGPGDTLAIELWGGVTQNITRTIERDGRIFLPEAGSLQVAGLPLGQAQSLIQGALKRQYRDAQIAVTISRLRTVRVYVVGDVQRPGGYDISSLATPLSALYAAGGPTAMGSLRTLRHYRGKQVVEDVDLYDFLLHGIRNGSAPFESGDTLLVPPAGTQVAVSGAIKRPAIYELKAGESTLSMVIDDAGGFTAAASLSHITIERIDANHQRETVTLHLGKQDTQSDHDAIAAFQVSDGDRIRVEPILPYSERAIYLEGHVARPGRMSYSDGLRLSDVLRSYRDMLPEPASHGEIIRLVPPDLHAETIGFNVPDVLIGNANIDLQPFDTIRIFGRYEVDEPDVTIRGEVLRPGTYPMSEGMTAAQLVHMAGGFKRDALLESADLTTYRVVNGNRVVEKLATIPIGSAVSGSDAHADVPLKPGDILSVHQITSWNDIGESITVQGQVRFPGSYGFQDGERLSSVLRRAGGLLSTAYPAGAVLVRDQVRELQQKSREELIRQIETNSAAARLSPSAAGASGGGTLQLIKAQQDQVLADLKSHPPTGRMVIHIDTAIDTWANTAADIELRRGDVLTIPKRPGFVLVTGQVYNAIALTFAPGKTADWYLSHAGGTTAAANRKEVFIIRANGSVVGRRSQGWFGGNVLSTKLNPGDVVVVPQKIIGASLFWRNLLATGQIAASIGITAAVASAAL